MTSRSIKPPLFEPSMVTSSKNSLGTLDDSIINSGPMTIEMAATHKPENPMTKKCNFLTL